MADRFQGLKKLPDQPVNDILARHRARLKLPDGIDGSAPPARVLAALDAAGRKLELLRLLAHVLPRREATWWACLAGRDIAPADAPWPTLTAAEAWVFKPGEATRDALARVLQATDPDDDTTCVALAALHALPDGALEEASMPGLTPAMVEMQVMKSLLAVSEPEAQATRQAVLIERGLDIARGGNGRVAGAAGGARNVL
jgi:hypothetical protein